MRDFRKLDATAIQPPRGEGLMISKFSKLGIATCALLATSFAANAADIPGKGGYYKGPPRSVVSYYNWTGFYVGINGGYGCGDSTGFTNAAGGVFGTSPKGGMVGGTLGYNWQTGAWVVRRRRRLQLARPQGHGRVDASAAPPARSRTHGWHGPRPRRLRLRSLAALPHRRRRLRPRQDRATPSEPSVETTRPAGPPASASNTPSSATGRPSSNISTSISARSTCGLSICTTAVQRQLHGRTSSAPA